jgi:RES domain-containing protein
MRLWRISSYPGLSGVGGLHADGRWHTRGKPVLYASEHPALAMVEAMAHMRLGVTAIPLTLKLIAIDVSEATTIAPTPDLPPGWQANEPTSQAIGDAWIARAETLLLRLPSAILAHSTNYLLNPSHADAATRLSEVEVEPFWFDRRYLR